MTSSNTRVILSVHIPKTGGTTLLHLLQSALGTQAVFTDYADDPSDPCSARNLDPDGYFAKGQLLPPGCRAVHGHFHINKYAATTNACRIAFLRDPVDTILSIHSYWQTLGHGRNSLHDYFLNNNLDVFEMARLPMLRYLLTRNYFQNVDMRSFDFIGRFESFSDDLQRLSTKINLPLNANIHLNQMKTDADHNLDLSNDHNVRARLRDILIEDVLFFEATINV